MMAFSSSKKKPMHGWCKVISIFQLNENLSTELELFSCVFLATIRQWVSIMYNEKVLQKCQYKETVLQTDTNDLLLG